jgi:hypothetical protein
MDNWNVRNMLVVLVAGLLVLCSLRETQATVYGWKGDGGVLHLSNDPEVIPELQRPLAQQFTSKFAGVTVPVVTESAPSAATTIAPIDAQVSAYQRGLEQGLQTAERQVELAGALARTVLEAAPRTPPVRIVVQQPGPVIIREVSPVDYSPFYGFNSPYGYADFPLWSACAPSSRFSFHYSFRCSRFVPHSHFFPGARRVRGELFLPQGHFSHHGFLSGPAFVGR